MSEYLLKSARYIALDALSRCLRPGDRAVDATMGNGHDTLTLCRLVGENGHVDAFDVQPQAVENTRALLISEGVLARAALHLKGHERMAEEILSPVRAVVFNLGWLPGGDKSVTTRWETTRQAVDAALSLLTSGGICTICVYPGHAAGEIERQKLLEYLSALRPQAYNALRHQFVNAGAGAPECLIIQRQ